MAVDAEHRKLVRYAHLEATHCFIPIAVETMAVFGPEACTFLKVISRRLIAASMEKRSHELEYR